MWNKFEEDSIKSDFFFLPQSCLGPILVVIYYHIHIIPFIKRFRDEIQSI